MRMRETSSGSTDSGDAKGLYDRGVAEHALNWLNGLNGFGTGLLGELDARSCCLLSVWCAHLFGVHCDGECE